MKIRLASPIVTDSVVDGRGLRTVIWCQGCYHGCEGCHNPDTHDFTGGFDKEIDELVQEILAVKMQSGVTFSGGDPMMQAQSCSQVASRLKEHGINIWCYTGFKFEELLEKPDCLTFLQYIDVLIDGKFELTLKSYDLLFKGSANQRIINVPDSLRENNVILYDF
ncbi:anaerobic ribonucleoside-triphosphate reductase activating protein [Pelosinus sp. sgz500959]|uniref:anaerobic ribonucleoside-triphosphate reductase activating protein n=1 Tax=Pelosinus sp. sgz500959 TaxID=3242472 RepID=UPI00366E76FD